MLLFPSRLWLPFQLPNPNKAYYPNNLDAGCWQSHVRTQSGRGPATQWGPLDPIWALCDGGGIQVSVRWPWFSPKWKWE